MAKRHPGCGYCKHHELSPIYKVYNCKLKHMFVSIFGGEDCDDYKPEHEV